MYPASQWVALHPEERRAVELARAVHEGHTVKVGSFKAEGKANEEENDGTEHLNIVEHVLEGANNFLPWLSLPLKRLLFDDPPLKNWATYAVLDAAVWKANGRDLRLELENSNLEWRCLFKDGAEEESEDVAPYLVDISWEHFNSDSPVSFHKALFEKFWEKNSGIFVRSEAPIDEIWTSLRKFTRIRDVDDKWFYIRFWEPEYFLYFFTFMKNTAMIRPLEKIPFFVMQIAGSAVSIEPNFDKLTVIEEGHDKQIDLIFDASTAMVAFRHIRELEDEYQGQVEEGEVFEAFGNLFGDAGMDYDDMKKCLQMIYIFMSTYKENWSNYLTMEVAYDCFDEDGYLGSYFRLLHGQCVFAFKNRVYPHALGPIGEVK